VSFSASAVDPEDGDLAAGLAWTSDLDGAIGTGAGFDLSTLSLGIHQIVASVTDSHGAQGQASIELTIAANTAPSVSIALPTPFSTSLTGEALLFSGSASDVEDGDLGASLVWTSDLDGSIGSGESFATSSLSEGTHLVTASALDSHGLSGEDSVVTIRLPEPGAEGFFAGLLGLLGLAARRRP
jgi:hypothetical protein